MLEKINIKLRIFLEIVLLLLVSYFLTVKFQYQGGIFSIPDLISSVFFRGVIGFVCLCGLLIYDLGIYFRKKR